MDGAGPDTKDIVAFEIRMTAPQAPHASMFLHRLRIPAHFTSY